MAFTALVAAVGIAILTLLAYTYPPTRSVTALRRRVDALETDYATDHTELKRLVKRYRALEGHVYGSMEPDDDEAAADGHNPAHAPGSASSLALLPDPDFPEEAFQRLVEARRTQRG